MQPSCYGSPGPPRWGQSRRLRSLLCECVKDRCAVRLVSRRPHGACGGNTRRDAGAVAAHRGVSIQYKRSACVDNPTGRKRGPRRVVSAVARDVGDEFTEPLADGLLDAEDWDIAGDDVGAGMGGDLGGDNRGIVSQATLSEINELMPDPGGDSSAGMF